MAIEASRLSNFRYKNFFPHFGEKISNPGPPLTLYLLQGFLGRFARISGRLSMRPIGRLKVHSLETGGHQHSDLFAHSILDAIKEEELSYPMV